MRDRLNQNDVTNRINVEDADAVCGAVSEIFAARYPGSDVVPIVRAFRDFRALFEGEHPGYLPCDTLYHDLRHSLDVTLAMARLIDGHDRLHAGSDRLGARRAMLGVLIALFHDAGYMKRVSESHVENGAVFTKVHVSRSADFLLSYLPEIGFGAEAPLAAKLVHFTGYEMEVDDIQLADQRDRALGNLVGTSDLIGQMSDRLYLEKCREFLYPEFVWASIAREQLADGREIVRYSSADDLLFKTPGFYEYVARTRIDKKLDNADRYAEVHFGGESLYQSEIDRNMDFLRGALQTADLSRLRRFVYSLSTRSSRAA
jgi:hypothetical protein